MNSELIIISNFRFKNYLCKSSVQNNYSNKTRKDLIVIFTIKFCRMKHFLLLTSLLLFFQVHISFAKQRELSKGSAVVFGADVLLRSIPSQQSSIIDVLPIASDIEILDKASELVTLNGIKDFWYKVNYNGNEGFIWGALIADNYFKTDLDADSTQETFMILNLTKGIYDEDFQNSNSRLEFRVARNNQLIYEHKRTSNYTFICDSIGFEKLPLYKSVIRAMTVKCSYMGETSAVGKEYFLFTGNNLDSLFSIKFSEGEGGYVCFSSLLFPDNKEVQPNSVAIKTKCADVSNCDDNAGKPCQWEYTTETLLWDGKKFNLKK